MHVSDILMGSLASLTFKVGKKAFDIVSTSEVRMCAPAPTYVHTYVRMYVYDKSVNM